MLFNYHYVPHTIETFQTWLDHLVKHVWCRDAGYYSLDLLHPDLKAVVEEISNDDSVTKDHLDGPIKTIDAHFRTLTPAQRQQVATWYDINNDIEALCAADPAKVPATYADIGRINAELADALKAFCKGLFTDVLDLKAVKSRIGDIDDHYRVFVTQNDEGKCPYCGCADIKGIDHSRREAYDHFLPKGTYPFNSVNFHNLAPMCHECNSTYKLQKDPTKHIDPIARKTSGARRRAFYSYATVDSGISISIALNTADATHLRPEDIDLQFAAPGRVEEVEAWRDVFGIDERYKAKCCAKNDGKAWLQHIVEECDNGKLTREELLAQVARAAKRSPWDSVNFLKEPFLAACKTAKLI